jgi:hypothetical protein
VLGSVAEQSVADRILISCEGEWNCPCLSRSVRQNRDKFHKTGGANDLLRMKETAAQVKSESASQLVPHRVAGPLAHHLPSPPLSSARWRAIRPSSGP